MVPYLAVRPRCSSLHTPSNANRARARCAGLFVCEDVVAHEHVVDASRGGWLVVGPKQEGVVTVPLVGKKVGHDVVVNNEKAIETLILPLDARNPVSCASGALGFNLVVNKGSLQNSLQVELIPKDFA